MKKFDLVKLINENPYYQYDLKKDMRGIVIKNSTNKVDVLFFNQKNTGNYALITVKNEDLFTEKESMPKNLQDELTLNLDKILANAKKT